MKTIRELIKDALRLYNRATRVKTLQTMEEIEANTENHCLAGAGAVAELNNKLAGLPEWIQDASGKITGYKTPGGADTVFPFSSFEKAKILTTASSNFVFTFPEEVSRFLIIDYTSSYNQHYSHTFYWDETLGDDRVCMDNFTTLNVFMTKSGNTFTIRAADDHTWQCKVIYWPK